MNGYDHPFSALTLPGQGELRNKDLEFALRQACSNWRICAFVEQLAPARAVVFSPIHANSGRTKKTELAFRRKVAMSEG